jgi:hypothetical protein
LWAQETKAQAVFSEAALLRAMFDVGYFPPNTPPAERLALNLRCPLVAASRRYSCRCLATLPRDLLSSAGKHRLEGYHDFR